MTTTCMRQRGDFMIIMMTMTTAQHIELMMEMRKGKMHIITTIHMDMGKEEVTVR